MQALCAQRAQSASLLKACFLKPKTLKARRRSSFFLREAILLRLLLFPMRVFYCCAFLQEGAAVSVAVSASRLRILLYPSLGCAFFRLRLL